MTSCFETDVIVVGAGIAGLTLAKLLQDDGIPTIILEQGPNPGGRILPSKFRTETQLGAEFIHGNHRGVSKLLEQAGLNVQDYLMDGGEGRIFKQGRLVHRQNSDFAREVELQYERLHGYKGTADLSVAEYASKLNIENQGPGYFARARVVRLEASALEDLSAIGLGQAMKNEGDMDRNSRVAGGFSKLINWLVTKSTVISGAKVANIIWRDNRLVVFCEDGVRYICRRVVLTLPIDILGSMLERFNPTLPQRQIEAVKSLRIGPAAKILIHVRQAHWPNFSAYATDEPIQVWWNHKHTKGHTLVGFVAGPGASIIEKLGVSDFKKQAIANIAAIGGSLKPENIMKVEKLVWNSGGKMAYSYIPVGAAWARDVLTENVMDLIWFAGEAAIAPGLAGTISGAIESAIRVAKNISDVTKADAKAYKR